MAIEFGQLHIDKFVRLQHNFQAKLDRLISIDINKVQVKLKLSFKAPSSRV